MHSGFPNSGFFGMMVTGQKESLQALSLPEFLRRHGLFRSQGRPHARHLQVGVLAGMGVAALEAHAALGDVSAQPDEAPREAEEQQGADGDAEDVDGDPAAGGRVEEAVDVEALGGLGQVRQRQVQGQQEDQPQHVQGRGRVRARDEDLEQREEAVQTVLGHVAPRIEPEGEPRARVQTTPCAEKERHQVSIYV